MADIIDKTLGISGAVSGLLGYMFYRFYRNKTETASKIRVSLKDNLNLSYYTSYNLLSGCQYKRIG